MLGGRPGQKMAIATYVLIVLFQGCAEKMSTESIRHEIEEVGISRGQRGTKRNLAVIPDRIGRQSAVHISIVGRIFV